MPLGPACRQSEDGLSYEGEAFFALKAGGAGRQAAVDVVRAEKHRMLLERLAMPEGEFRRS